MTRRAFLTARPIVAAAAAWTVALVLVATSPARAAPPFRVRHGAVASDSGLASQVGARVLQSGGNAVDAACATALALGVVHPFASGLGGGGFALVYRAKTRTVAALDFRETAPAALRPELFAPQGKPDPLLSTRGGLAVGVPGEAAGLHELVRRWGNLPFQRCVQPAAKLARGFPASPWLVEHIADELRHDPQGSQALLASLFALHGRNPAEIQAGQTLHRPGLATTLETLGRQGPSVFYRGAIGHEIVQAVRGAGGVLSQTDLAGYVPLERTPLATTFRGRHIFVMPPPSAGGVLIIQALGILSQRLLTWDPVPAGPEDPAYLHLLAEALKHGFADRSRHLGDPDFVDVPWPRLIDPGYLQRLAAGLRDDAVLPHDQYGQPYQDGSRTPGPTARDAGTAHLAVIDSQGNAVALTTTVNLEFGAHLVAGSTGILLNDEMDDFALASGQADSFGLVGSPKNAVAPGRRPLSSMSPTIVVRDGQVEAALGAAGGPTIISTTLQVLLDLLLFGQDPQAAVDGPRIHHQWQPDVLQYEPGLRAQAVDALVRRGHHLKARAKMGKANLVARQRDGLLEATAEPRSGGAPAGF